MHRRAVRRAAATVAVLVAAALAATGCSAGPGAARLTDNRPKGGIATVAGVFGAGPNWIFPFGSLPTYNTANYQDFIDLMYRPLYLFGGNNDSLTVNYALSPARAPVYRDGGRVVSISLKGWKWSDGERVDAADVVFWLNMDEAEKQNWPGYMKGGIPDNLVSYHAVGRDTVVLTLTRAYASTWFTYNELAQITPMPLAWDITRVGAAAGSGGCAQDTAADHWARCQAVYEFLTAQAKDPRTYTATSPLWSVVDGPWRLRSFSITGNVTLVPNRQYSGSPRPALAALRYVSYSGDAALAALRAGQVDVAVIPQQDLPPRAAGSLLPAKSLLGRAFYLQPAYNDGINYFALDFQDRGDRALFSQLYFRQALQELTNQQAITRVSYGGYAIPTTGGVPNVPPSGWIPADMTANKGAGLYPYDPARAEKLLAAHGWSVVNGTLTCERPGNLPSDCGAGIGRGRTANLGFAAAWVDGPAQQSQSPMGIVRADLATAGIRLSLSYPMGLLAPAPCAAPSCSTAMQYVGEWEFDGPGYAPTGEPLFQTDASWNLGLYSSAQMNSLISAVQTSNRRNAFHAYASYTATQLPVIWLPDPYSVVAVSKRLRGVTQSPLSSFYPEYWYFTSA
jgi:peptide/nickel transport system substrate-binding protein